MSLWAQLPTGPSGVVAPSAWAASSITTRGRWASERRGRRAGRRSGPRPAHRCSDGTAPGRGSAWSGRCRGARRRRRRTGRSWRWPRTSAAEVATTSPGPSPPQQHAPCSAAVPLAKATAWRRPVARRRTAPRTRRRPGPGSASRPAAPDDGGDVVVVDRLAAVRDHGRTARELVGGQATRRSCRSRR